MNGRELESLKLLVRSLMGAGRFAAARNILAGLLQDSPDDPFARRNLVQAHLNLGEYADAEPLTRRLAEEATGPARAPAWFFHAHALWGCGRLDECRAAVHRYAESLKAERESADGGTSD